MQEREAEPLAPHTTLRVGGPARRFLVAETSDDLVDAVREVDDADEPLLILGGGSNVVIADEGFEGTVVHVANRGVAIESADGCSGASIRIGAGEPWDDVVRWAVEEGWIGIEALSGIPGLAGATPVQNVGAYGQEVADTIAQVRTWDRVTSSMRTFAATDCGFGYRTSLFKQTSHRGAGRYVVLDVLLQLRLGDLSAPIGYADLARQLDVAMGERVPLADAREAVLAQRRLRGMVLDPADHDTWSAGSFFTNPILGPVEHAALLEAAAHVVGPGGPPVPSWTQPDGSVKVSAAWLIDRAGLGKGYGSPGPATLSTKHTLALTNRGDARAADIVDLAREVRDRVAEVFGVRLVPEPILVGIPF